jgi:probable dihydroxyacetone kinase regulator
MPIACISGQVYNIFEVKHMTHKEATLQTKTALATSLKKFMSKKPLSKITVSEIIADCNVNRKTFYYHFDDIYALLKWTLEQEAVDVVKDFNLLNDYEEVIRFVVRYVRENAHILNCAYDSMGRDELKRFLYHDFESLIRRAVNDTEKNCGLSVTEDFKTFLSDFFTEAAASKLVNCFQDSNDPDVDQIIRHISVMIASLPDILHHAPQAKNPQ